MTKHKTEPLDISEHLQTKDDILEFLKEVKATGSESDCLHALDIALQANDRINGYMLCAMCGEERARDGLCKKCADMSDDLACVFDGIENKRKIIT